MIQNPCLFSCLFFLCWSDCLSLPTNRSITPFLSFSDIIVIIISELTVFELPPLDVMPGEKNYMWL